MNPNVGGLGGYGDPRSQGMIKGLGEGTPLTQLFKGRIPDGSLVEGVVLNEGEGAYLVRVAGQLFQARSTIPLFVGQHFRALYDASGEVPLLRLTQEDLALVASFEGKERTIATALLARGLPLSDDMLWIMRQAWAGTGNDPKALGSLMELWARNLPMTAENATLLSWYLELDPSEAARLWGEIRDRLRSRERNRPEEILGDLRSGSEESTKFLKAHALVSRPSREGVDPSALLASAWWPVEDREEGYPLLARVAAFMGERADRKAWRVAFEVEGRSLGTVAGDVVTNGRALTADLFLRGDPEARYLRSHLGELSESLSEVSLPVQHLGVSLQRPRPESEGRKVDMEI